MSTPETNPPAKPAGVDAVLIPDSYTFQTPGNKVDRMAAINREFGPILGTRTVYSAVNGSNIFAHAAKHEDMNFRKDSDRSGESRFKWKDRGDGVLYGTKVEGADDDR